VVLKREPLRWPCFAETSDHLGIFRARFTLFEGLIAAFSVMGCCGGPNVADVERDDVEDLAGAALRWHQARCSHSCILAATCLCGS